MDIHNQNGLSTMGWLLTGAAVIVLLIIALPLLGYGGLDVLTINRTQPQESALGESAESPSPSPAATQSATSTPIPSPTNNPGTEMVDEIVNNPDSYLGQQITLTATVANMITSNVFTLNGTGNDLSKDLVVINRQAVASPGTGQVTLTNGDTVQATGVLQRLDTQNLQNQLGVTLDENSINMLSRYDGLPMLIADEIVPVSEEANTQTQ